MAAVRQNVVTNPGALANYVEGVLALKQEHLGITTDQLGIGGAAVPVSTYDLFMVWHHLAMGQMTPPNQFDRNAAHSGPVFLPWHRLMMILLELQMQRVLGNDAVGLPYWDWAADGDLPAVDQTGSALWLATGVGGTGDPIADGPFAWPEFRVTIHSDRTGALQSVDRGLRRSLGEGVPTLPTSAQMAEILDNDQLAYDTAPWDRSTLGLRNRLEGWRPVGPAAHNRVHVWVGGDMGPASSPNDPVFYLNHCNVDRLWEAWMVNYGRNYTPGPAESVDLLGHRLNDALYSILIRQEVTPAMMLEVSDFYSYDELP